MLARGGVDMFVAHHLQFVVKCMLETRDHHVSHETIYCSLCIQARGALKKELLAHLRRTNGMRRSRHYTQKTAILGKIVDAVSISEWPGRS